MKKKLVYAILFIAFYAILGYGCAKRAYNLYSPQPARLPVGVIVPQ